MTRFLTVTRERFLLAIAEQVPDDRIEEIHFFPPMTQGGMESGVAVVAATLAEPESDRQTEGEPAPGRFTVFTANYRLTLKGPDRGSWDVSIVEEADAPLLTVEKVARGVQHRAGDVDDPERYDGAELRGMLDAARARARS